MSGLEFALAGRPLIPAAEEYEVEILLALCEDLLEQAWQGKTDTVRYRLALDGALAIVHGLQERNG